MKKSRKLLFGVFSFILLIASSSMVHAANAFSGVTDILEDALELIGSFFTLPIFSTPQGALGFLLFLLWVMLLAILHYAMGFAFRQMQKRQRTVIAVIIATMTVIFLNFQKSLLYAVLGNWLIWIYFILVFGVVGILIYVAATRVESHWVKAGIYFLALMITLSADDDLVTFVQQLEALVNYYVLAFPLTIILKNSLRKWYQQ